MDDYRTCARHAASVPVFHQLYKLMHDTALFSAQNGTTPLAIRVTI
jgi:hypothetical protein